MILIIIYHHVIKQIITIYNNINFIEKYHSEINKEYENN